MANHGKSSLFIATSSNGRGRGAPLFSVAVSSLRKNIGSRADKMRRIRQIQESIPDDKVWSARNLLEKNVSFERVKCLELFG